MRHIPFILAALILASCATQSGRGTLSVAWDNEKSFADFGLMATAVATAGFSAAVDKAREVTTQKSNANAARVDINSSNNATSLAKEGLKAKTTTTGQAIGAGAPLGPVQVNPP